VNRAYGYWQPILAFSNGVLVKKIETEIKGVQPLLSFS
jgi:hypothetical protein